TGLLLLVVIPGAFVEPDEEEMKQKSVLSRVKVYSAGSMANFLVAAFFLVLLLSIPRIPDGVQIYETIPGTPADQIGLEGAIIYQMDGSAVDTYEQFSQELERYNPGDELTLDTNRGILTLTLTEHPDEEGQGYMGVYPIQHYKYFMILDIFSWISMLNLSVALFNLFPISSILDGGKITDEILRHYFSDTTSRRLSAAFGVIALGILAVNLLGNVIA
ncbi:MAG: site-2 protease family protein, partial [Theionarchaea archaeon]|nr:site-2 protease family protein [Theionarchaea archaeon]